MEFENSILGLVAGGGGAAKTVALVANYTNNLITSFDISDLSNLVELGTFTNSNLDGFQNNIILV